MQTLSAPFRGNALAVNLIFAALLGTLLLQFRTSGLLSLMGLPALLILLPWFLKYCLVVGREASYGRAETPTMSLEHLNPLEIQPIALALGLVLLHWALVVAFGRDVAAVGVALIAPAAVAVLVVEDSAIAALDPRNLLRYAIGLGLAYPLFVILLFGGLWLAARVAGSGLGAYATVFALQSILIATFDGAGRLLKSRDDRIGYARPETAEERTNRLSAQEQQRAFEQVLSEAYAQAEAGQREQALATVLDHVRERGDDESLYAEASERLLAWPDSVVGLAFLRHYVERLQSLGAHGQALTVFLRGFDMNSELRPIGPEDTLAIARLARERGREDVADVLLSDFSGRFPGHDPANEDSDG